MTVSSSFSIPDPHSVPPSPERYALETPAPLAPTRDAPTWMPTERKSHADKWRIGVRGRGYSYNHLRITSSRSVMRRASLLSLLFLGPLCHVALPGRAKLPILGDTLELLNPKKMVRYQLEGREKWGPALRLGTVPKCMCRSLQQICFRLRHS